MVAGDDHEDPARAGDRHALRDPHHLPRGFGRRESPLPGGRVPGAVRRGQDLPVQLDHAPLPAHPAARRGHGSVHRRGRVPAGALGRDPHGGRHQLHGTGRPQPGEGRDRSIGGQGNAGGRGRAHRGQRRRALSGRQRRGLPGEAAGAGCRSAAAARPFARRSGLRPAGAAGRGSLRTGGPTTWKRSSTPCWTGAD